MKNGGSFHSFLYVHQRVDDFPIISIISIDGGFPSHGYRRVLTSSKRNNHPTWHQLLKKHTELGFAHEHIHIYIYTYGPWVNVDINT